MSENKKETLGFQTEVKQMLHLMVHSLYSNREIFLRELVSNASDAIDKLRFAAIDNPSLLADDPHPSIRVGVDEQKQEITVSDDGIGMTRAEVIEHLGTIAKSGTREFFARLSGDQKKDSQLIGQFGVGFYFSFIIAHKVTVITRKAGDPADAATKWEGEGEFPVENTTRDHFGTDVILSVKSEDRDLVSKYRLRTILQRYSDHISTPILMGKDEYKDDKVIDTGEWEAINTFGHVRRMKLLKTSTKSSITTFLTTLPIRFAGRTTRLKARTNTSSFCMFRLPLRLTFGTEKTYMA